MRYLPKYSVGLILAGVAITGPIGTASAAWNNVFQVCCNDCNKPRTSYYAPPAAACPQPQPEVRISYVQRSYYQPVTEYVSKSYYEPVTKNYTSYYYEPVTEYKYTTYYDPCTGCPQKVCTPSTSYRMRSKCNSVTSYVERTAMVPVQTLRPVTVRQPVVTYYYPPEMVGSSGGTAPIMPSTGPSVEQLRENPPSIQPIGGSDSNIPPQNIPSSPGTSYQKAIPNTMPKIRLDKTTSRSSVVTVRGEVVMPDQMTPRPGVKLVFLSAENKDKKEYVTANEFGEFDLKLPAGKWFLYIGEKTGQAVYHKQVSLGDKATYDYKVVSR